MNELGYFIDNICDDWFIKRIRQKFLNLFECQNDTEVIKLYRENKPHWVTAYDQLRYLPEIYQLASSFLVLVLAKKAGIKNPAIGAKLVVRADMPNDDEWSFPPHQDAPYNPGSGNRITIWIPFQDVGMIDGALRVIPGSHLAGELPSKDNLLIARPPAENYMPVPVKCGQVLAFSQFLIHTSGPNRSDTVRFSLQVRFNDLNELVHDNAESLQTQTA